MDYITLKFTSVRKFSLITPLCLCGLYCFFRADTETPKELVFFLAAILHSIIICIRVNCLCNSAAGNTWAVLEEISARSSRSQCLWSLSSVTQDPLTSLNLGSFSWGSSPTDVWNTRLSCPHASSRCVEPEWVQVGTCPWLLSCKVLRVENVPTGKWWAFIMPCELQPASQCIKDIWSSLSFFLLAWEAWQPSNIHPLLLDCILLHCPSYSSLLTLP